MFNKLKQFQDLRGQAKVMQNTLGQEKIEVEKNGIKLVMNGNMEVTEFTINNQLDPSDIAKITKDLINDAIKKIQRIMAKKMQEMGGFPGLM